jgi:hypothetical protein
MWACACLLQEGIRMVSLKPDRLKRYSDIALLLVKYGRSDLIKHARWAEGV